VEIVPDGGKPQLGLYDIVSAGLPIDAENNAAADRRFVVSE
jgi:hypothetical protein